jgi:transcriptional regulator with XRE-family HTH domain
MMTLQQIRRGLADKNLAEVGRRIGMSRQQLWLIAVGINANPTTKTLEKISEYLSNPRDYQ